MTMNLNWEFNPETRRNEFWLGGEQDPYEVGPFSGVEAAEVKAAELGARITIESYGYDLYAADRANKERAKRESRAALMSELVKEFRARFRREPDMGEFFDEIADAAKGI